MNRPRSAPSYYVWYRLEGEPAGARATVTAMMLDIATECGIAGRLLVRADDPSTWMEVYEEVDHDDFRSTLARAADLHGAVALARDGRHVECFVACDDVAGD